MEVAELAGRALEKLDGQLNCSICLEGYTDPKLIRCGHYFCLKCLERLLKPDGQKFILRCPTCRTVTRIPNRNVAGLQPAFHLAELWDIRECVEIIKDTVESVGNIRDTEHPLRRVSYCPDHENTEVVIFCETCEKPICFLCTESGNHQEHKFVSFREAFKAYSEKMPQYNESLRDVRVLSFKLKYVIDTLDDIIRMGSRDANDLDFFVKKRETATNQHDLVSNWMTDLTSKMAGVVSGPICSFTDPAEVDWFSVVTQIRAQQEFCSSIETVLQEIKKIDLLVPSECHAVGKGLHFAFTGKQSSAIVYVMGINGPALGDVTESIRCELVFMNGYRRPMSKCIVKKIEQNRYEVSYLPVTKGVHLLHIYVDRMDIQSSPFHITTVDRFDRCVSTMLFHTMTLSSFELPFGVAVNREGTIYVIGLSTVSVFSPNGERIQLFDVNIQPVCIVIDNDGNLIMLSDLLMFGSLFRLIFKLTPRGILINKVYAPHMAKSISFNSYNNKIYVLVVNGFVRTLTSDFAHHTDLECPQVSNCKALACNSSGWVYVATSSGVSVFNSNMTLMFSFGGSRLDLPVDIAVDSSGTVHVIDSRHISSFTWYGRFLESTKRISYGHAYPKEALAAGPNRTLYVCEARCIRVYSCEHVFNHRAIFFNFILIVGVIVVLVSICISIFFN